MKHSERLQQIRAFLEECAAQGHYTPTLREIGKAVGIRSSSHVQHHVNTLVSEDFCQRDDKGHLRLKRPAPVVVRHMRGTTYKDGNVYLAPVSGVCIEDGKAYRVEVYEC